MLRAPILSHSIVRNASSSSRVETAQVSAEFQTIDDLRVGSEADVFGPKITMPLHDSAIDQALQQQIFVSVDEGLDASRDALGRVAQRGIAAVLQR